MTTIPQRILEAAIKRPERFVYFGKDDDCGIYIEKAEHSVGITFDDGVYETGLSPVPTGLHDLAAQAFAAVKDATEKREIERIERTLDEMDGAEPVKPLITLTREMVLAGRSNISTTIGVPDDEEMAAVFKAMCEAGGIEVRNV